MKDTPQTDQIQYDLLIDRLIGDFRPAKVLWPVGARLAMWLLLEFVIITPLVLSRGYGDLSVQLQSVRYLLELGIFLFIGVATAGLALRSAIPGREATQGELLLISAPGLVSLALMLSEPVPTVVSAGQFIPIGSTCLLYIVSLAAVPWLVLFRAVRRGVPLQPEIAGGLVGAAAFCFAFVAVRLVWPVNDSSQLLMWQLLPIGLGTALSILAGAAWLSPERLWEKDSKLSDAVSVHPPTADTEERILRRLLRPRGSSPTSRAIERALFPVALAAAVVLLVMFLRPQREMAAAVPDFDLAIQSYGRSLTNFTPNVPSDSPEALLKAYIEHGMPPYMWDFGPGGYKLVGGRFDPLPDGTPITYTLFRGNRGAIICMFKATDGFNPPAGVYKERRHYLFYHYKGYSICLNNVGGYGNYICVLVARLPMKEFMRNVLAVAP
jgi:hypothetical protein